MDFFNLIETSIELGLEYSLITMGLIISFKIIKFPDMSVDGTFAMGGAITAVCIQIFNSPFMALILTIISAIIVGFITASLNIYMKINKILSGILIMISLYSVNLRIMGKANIPITNKQTLISFFETNSYTIIFFFLAIILIIGMILVWFFKTEFGLMMRMSGDNSNVVKNNGRKINKFTIIGLCMSSTLVALTGSLVSQRQGFSDVNMGVGIIIIGLACLFIGDAIVKPKNIALMILSAVIGTIVYQFVIGLGLRVGLSPSDIKILTAGIVILALSVFNKSKQTIIEDKISFND